MSSAPLYDRPGPPRLPPKEQAEFDALVRAAEEQALSAEAAHPDSPTPVSPEFEGDVNPVTGERGGPKREPVRQWNEGDWSYKGRVSDF
jgi:hypothetical protein